MLLFRSALLSAVVSCAIAASAAAHDHAVVYGGSFDVFDSDSSAQVGAEYRWHGFGYHVRPTVGVNIDHHGAKYLYGGFNWELPVTSQLYISPNFMAGLYGQGGGKDLGGAVEFRSGVEVGYELPNHGRVGIALNHISNASIYDENPGAEAVIVSYQHPLEW